MSSNKKSATSNIRRVEKSIGRSEGKSRPCFGFIYYCFVGMLLMRLVLISKLDNSVRFLIEKYKTDLGLDIK